MRRRAWRIWQVYTNGGGNNPLLLRTWYNPADNKRVESWATLSEEFADDADWAILDTALSLILEPVPGSGYLRSCRKLLSLLYKISRLSTSAEKTGARIKITIPSTLVLRKS